MSRVNDGLVNTDEAGNTTFYYLDGTAIDLMYDERNRLVTLTHGYGSYRYDAENNRIRADGTKYTYDASDGRNRLVESIDSDGNITIYGYGALGLVWSKCGDEYMVYHYDYRGSVTAVTDKDGNITDTLKYDAYGNVSERTGSSKLLFTYNGQYGVQTDKSGYLYMRTRYYNPKFRRFMSADVIDGSIADSTTLNLYTYVNGNPISFVDPFGLSSERARNNEKVINDLHWLFNCSYDYFSSYKNEAERIRVTNDAVMKYLICQKYYFAGTLQGIAWDIAAGELDRGYLLYMSQHNEFLSVRESTFYDPDSGKEIDFLHMIATLCAYNYESTSGALFTIPSAYAGWAGDLITLAGDVYNHFGEDDDTVNLTKTLIESADSHFSLSDLMGDIDAVFINKNMSTMPIDKAFEAYYSSDCSNRYSRFLESEYGGHIDFLYNDAIGYLSPGIYNAAFRTAFGSKYSNDIIPYVAQGFTEYVVYGKVGMQ